jgi:hypothetical protein
MTFVLVRDGPGCIKAARVIAEKRRTVGRHKNVRILSCRVANDYVARNAESRPFEVYPSMILAEWEDDYDTSDVHLDYQAALKHLARKWAAHKSQERK